jgi:hypothetical protein
MGGKRAVRVEAESGVAVHEFAQNGAFSPRGPYLIRLRNPVWALSGRRHLVEVRKARVSTANPSGGKALEVGVRIAAWNTDHHAPVTLREYATTVARAERITTALNAAASTGAVDANVQEEETARRWAAGGGCPSS